MAVLSIAAHSTVCAATFTVLHSFAGGNDGAHPYAGIILAPDNNLYGTTFSGGANNSGTVYKLSLTGSEQVINDEVYSPAGTLLADPHLNLYGTAIGPDYGTVFRIDAGGKETVLHTFSGQPDGEIPEAGLVTDEAGNLYGTTWSGGVDGYGTVFEIHYPAPTSKTESVLYSFKGQPNDGAGSYSTLIRDQSGNLYGTTNVGGSQNEGTVFTLSPDGAEAVIFEFSNDSGFYPRGNLIANANGNLYGTTSEGGPYGGQGTVYKITPDGNETILYAFGTNGPWDGGTPYAGVIADTKGNLYGTTTGGGAHSAGTVYRLSTDGKEKILYSFTGYADGWGPMGGLTWIGTGTLCGTTNGGGAYGLGTVFVLALK
ncbi:MAG TPA: choice-of-anchor tandem repeat GloVer-containing protein [Rhizomicrobium sp.]|nr:choice-of-anchor tandem repeat GloVer-containing protein [Rhizomicrobium sp.]